MGRFRKGDSLGNFPCRISRGVNIHFICMLPTLSKKKKRYDKASIPITASGMETLMATLAAVVRSDDELADALRYALAVLVEELFVLEVSIEDEDVEEEVIEDEVVVELVKGPN